MEIDQFVAVTRNVIRKQGFNDFQPTACFPERRELRVLAGAPDGPQEEIALRWAADLALAGEEYLVAFRHSSTEIKVVRFARGEQEEGVYAAGAALRRAGRH